MALMMREPFADSRGIGEIVSVFVKITLRFGQRTEESQQSLVWGPGHLGLKGFLDEEEEGVCRL